MTSWRHGVMSTIASGKDESVSDETRIVALARVFSASCGDPSALADARNDLEARAAGLSEAEGWLGRAVHHEADVFRQADPAVSSDVLEVVFFENMVPAQAISWALETRAASLTLQRCDLMVATPGSFHGPTVGSSRHLEQAGFKVSLEYIDVRAQALDQYRHIMRSYCGPAGALLVEEGTLGSFRALETVATLFQASGPQVPWNQIHLFEVHAAPIEPFFQHFDRAIRQVSSGNFETVFGTLDEIRTVPRWVLCP